MCKYQERRLEQGEAGKQEVLQRSRVGAELGAQGRVQVGHVWVGDSEKPS